MQELRRTFLDTLGDVNKLVGLEIGALNRPVVQLSADNSEGQIFYLDHLSTTGLRQKYEADPAVDIDAIVNVDFICPDGNILKAVGDKKFDYIVASHVVEHVPNPIQWLKDLFEILKPGGFLFLVVPDKRFTFDFQRPISTFGQMVEAYLNKQTIPSISAVYDQFSSALNVDGGKVWAGLIRNMDLLPLTSHSEAWSAAKAVHSAKTYFDVHVSIFTPWSFFGIIERLIENQILFCQVCGFNDTQPGQIEFMVSLKKPESTHLKISKVCLESIPTIPFESFTAPYMGQIKSLTESFKTLTESFKTLTESFKTLNDIFHQTAFELAQEKERSEHIHTLLHEAHKKINAEQAQRQNAESHLRRRSVRLALRISHYLNFWR